MWAALGSLQPTTLQSHCLGFEPHNNPVKEVERGVVPTLLARKLRL